MQHLAVLALIVGNMASVGAIVMSVGTWRQLRAEFLRHFIAFQTLVFFAGLCELMRRYLDANLGVDGTAPSVAFAVAVSMATLLGLVSLIRSVEAILSHSLGWLTATVVVVAIPLVVASTLQEAGLRVGLASAEVVVALQVLLIVALLTFTSQMLTTSSARMTRQRALAVRLAGVWFGGKVLFDSFVAAALYLGMIGLSGALAAQGAGRDRRSLPRDPLRASVDQSCGGRQPYDRAAWKAQHRRLSRNTRFRRGRRRSFCTWWRDGQIKRSQSSSISRLRPSRTISTTCSRRPASRTGFNWRTSFETDSGPAPPQYHFGCGPRLRWRLRAAAPRAKVSPIGFGARERRGHPWASRQRSLAWARTAPFQLAHC